MSLKEQYGLPKYSNRIQREDGINTDNGHILDKCLHNDEAIKGIFVVRRQMLEGKDMRDMDRENLNTVDEVLAFNNLS